MAKEIELEDPYENMGAQMVREVASKTSDIAGDGTTTATVLAEAIYREGLKNVTAGANPTSLQRGINKAVEAIVAELAQDLQEGQATARKSRRSPPSPPTGTRTIGEIIADAMDKVGKDGTITVEEAKSIETTLDVVEGMQFDKGYLSPYFVTNAEVDGSHPRQRLHPHPREEDPQPQGHAPAPREGREDRQAAPHHRGRRRRRSPRDPRREQAPRHPQRRAVKAPGFGDRRKAMLEDIAILTGGQLHHRRPRHQAREHRARRPRPRQARHDRQGKHHHRRRRRQAGRHPGPRRTRSAARSKKPPPITTARSSRSASRSSPAAWPSSMSAPRPKPR